MIHNRHFAALLVTVVVATGQFEENQLQTVQGKYLRIYGSSGPGVPIKECAQLFSQYNGIDVLVTSGPESDWTDRALQDADLIYAGAEYVLAQFTQAHPGFIDLKTRTSLYERPVGILVRKGNPRRIQSISDLARPGIRHLDVVGSSQIALWEDIAGLKHLIQAIQKNIILTVQTSDQAFEKWRSMPGIDAWVTFESWYYRDKSVADLVQLPYEERMCRGTPIALTKGAKNRSLAMKFIEFLKSEQARAIFQKWGWE
ncbi:MAG: substrate-binding domain-containing protein [Bacteroidota bacterium]